MTKLRERLMTTDDTHNQALSKAKADAIMTLMSSNEAKKALDIAATDLAVALGVDAKKLAKEELAELGPDPAPEKIIGLARELEGRAIQARIVEGVMPLAGRGAALPLAGIAETKID